MAVFAVHSQERNTNIGLLNDIIEKSVARIEAIDGALQDLVASGLKGSAVDTMSNTYQTNRETISELLKEFAKYSVELQEQETRLTNLDTEASQSAVGTPIQ